MRRMDGGLVEHLAEPAMNRCLYKDFCASLDASSSIKMLT